MHLAALAFVLLSAPHSVVPVLVDDDATQYATFQSHNQKIVQTGAGIFMAYIRTRNEAFTAQQWRLLRSVDSGKTFETVYEATHATNPPVLENDAAGNLYLVRPDFQETNAYLYRFLAGSDFRSPIVHVIPNGSAGKYALAMDSARDQLYFASHNGYFAVLGTDGSVRSSVQSHVTGPIAVQQYPNLLLDASGTIHYAWTTNDNARYLYRSIHYMRSHDGGQHWERLNGTALSLPVVADDAGPADRINLDDELDVHTFLSSMAVIGKTLHFAYLAQFPNVPRQHYMRYDLETAKRDIDMLPVFRSAHLEVMSLDGFFSTGQDGVTGSPVLFYTSQHQGRIVTLRSEDQGATWQDHAVSEPMHAPYAIAGMRTVSADGYLLGAFTSTNSAGKSSVYFLRIPAARP